MAKANVHARYFTRRGEVDTEIDYMGEKILITVSIPTNWQNDKLMEEFTEMSSAGTNIRGAELIEARLLRNIVGLPFKVPRTEDVDGEYVEWSDANDTEKQCAIRIMDTNLREIINNTIVGEAQLTEEEVGN